MRSAAKKLWCTPVKDAGYSSAKIAAHHLKSSASTARQKRKKDNKPESQSTGAFHRVTECPIFLIFNGMKRGKGDLIAKQESRMERDTR